MTRMLTSRLKRLESRTAKIAAANRVVFVDQLSGRTLSKVPSGVGVMIVPTWGTDAQWEAAMREQQIQLLKGH